jgi:hypothetical protein
MAAGPPAGAAAAPAGTAAAGVAAVPSLTVTTDCPPSVASALAGIWIFEPQWGQIPRLPAKNALTFNFFPQLSQWNFIPIALSSIMLNEWPNPKKTRTLEPGQSPGQPSIARRYPETGPTLIIRSSHFL